MANRNSNMSTPQGGGGGHRSVRDGCLRYLKAIGASDAANPLLDKAVVEPDDGVVGTGEAFVKAATLQYYAREPALRTLA